MASNLETNGRILNFKTQMSYEIIPADANGAFVKIRRPIFNQVKSFKLSLKFQIKLKVSNQLKSFKSVKNFKVKLKI